MNVLSNKADFELAFFANLKNSRAFNKPVQCTVLSIINIQLIKNVQFYYFLIEITPTLQKESLQYRILRCFQYRHRMKYIPSYPWASSYTCTV